MPPSKSRRMEKGRQIQSIRRMQAHARDSYYRNGRVRRCKAGEWTSCRPRNLAALEISPQDAATLN